jgi:hypothetical protein
MNSKRSICRYFWIEKGKEIELRRLSWTVSDEEINPLMALTTLMDKMAKLGILKKEPVNPLAWLL